MAAFICVVATLCAVAGAAPPTSFYPGQQQQQVNPLDYFLDNSEVANYYAPPQHKQANRNAVPTRLENLDPDSEVELVQGAQQPQQPPQQNPVSPNIPGLIPGQRVFIVHMPVVPGTIGGYQPVYIVAGAPQANAGAYPGNGYHQNAILLDPSAQAVPVNGFYRPRPVVPQQNPGYLGPLGLQRPYDLYQDPILAYQQPTPSPALGGVVLLPQAAHDHRDHPSANVNAHPNQTAVTDPKRVGQASESKEQKEEPRRNARPAPAPPRQV